MDTVMLDIATTTRETFSIEIHRPNVVNIENKMKDLNEVLTFQDADGVQVFIPVRHILSLAILEKGQETDGVAIADTE